MNIFNFFKKKRQFPIDINFKSFKCAWKENKNLTQAMRSQGMFSVTIERDGVKTTNIVSGINEKLLRNPSSNGVIARLNMLEISNSGEDWPAIVELSSDGGVRAYRRDEVQITEIPLENIDFNPMSTTYSNSKSNFGKFLSNQSPSKNYVVVKDGFKIQDKETGHIIEVSWFLEQSFTGRLLIPEHDLTKDLGVWMFFQKGPFKDDRCFEGTVDGHNGAIYFCVRPSTSFSDIIKQAKELRR